MFAFAVLASSRVPRYPVCPVAPIFRIPRPFPRPVPLAKINGEEEEDPENIWGTIAKEVIKEAAKSAAAEAIYDGAKWGYHKVFGQEAESNAEEEQDPENILPIIAALAEEAAYTAAFEAGKWIGKKYFHKQEAESNAEEQIDPENIWPIVVAIAEEVAISAATDAAIAGGKWAWHKLHGQEAESNSWFPKDFKYPYIPIRPVYKLNSEEEEDDDNIWGTVAKEIIKEAAKSAAAQAIYDGAKWGWHKVFGQEAESNSWSSIGRRVLPFTPIGPFFAKYRYNSEEEEDDDNIWGTIAKEVIKEAAKSAAADAIYSGAKWGWHKVFGQEAESNSFAPKVVKPIWKAY